MCRYIRPGSKKQSDCVLRPPGRLNANLLNEMGESLLMSNLNYFAYFIQNIFY